MSQSEAAGCFKAIKCLIYQCSEGKIDESDLYAELEKAAATLAYRIVETMPEYEKAPWG